MNAVVSNSAADHVDDVACQWGLDVGQATVWKGSRHEPHGSAVYQRFSDVSVIKDNGSVDGWNS